MPKENKVLDFHASAAEEYGKIRAGETREVDWPDGGGLDEGLRSVP